MSITLGPKLRQLSHNETLSSLESWFSMVRYNLALNKEFQQFLKIGVKFGRKSRAKPSRDLKDDTTGEASARVSKETKCVQVDMMLDQVANWADVIPRNDITKDCESLDDVWQTIRRYYNLETTGSLLNQAWNLVRQPDETPQALYSRLKQLYDDNLLRAQGLTHLGSQLTEDEEITPTLQNTIVLHWLELLHPRLRDVVTQRFSAELRDKTYATIFPEISRSINDLIAEATTGASVMRFTSSSRRGYGRGRQTFRDNSFRSDRGRGFSSASTGFKQGCDYCRLAKRQCYRSHDMRDCIFLSQDNAKVYGATEYESEQEYDEEHNEHVDAYMVTEHILNRVSSFASPVLPLYLHHDLVNCTLDSGATCNTVKSSLAKQCGLQVRQTNQTVRLADGNTPLRVEGETDMTFHRNGREFHMVALVVTQSDTDILCGMPFMTSNDIALRPARSEIIIAGEEVVKYDPVSSKPKVLRVCQSYDVVSRSRQVILPGQSWSFKLPPDYDPSVPVAIEPRYDTSDNSRKKETSLWPPPQIVEPVDGVVSVPNKSADPIIMKRTEKVVKVLKTYEPPDVAPTSDIPVKSRRVLPDFVKDIKKVVPFSTPVQLDPDNLLTPSTKVLFKEVLEEYDNVFDPKISRYNDHSGICKVEINMGNTKPPQRKGRIPLYGKSNMELLQQKMDELEAEGILRKPQELGIKVEYVSPSFLVRKRSGDFRLVTDFTAIAPYIKPVPSMLPDVNTTLLKIGSWKYIVRTDLTKSYHQLELKRSSMRYCGVVTPFKGTRVYTAGVMGLPGTESTLEEMTCYVLGDLVERGIVAKIADDLFIGGNTETELLDNFRLVLNRLQENNLKLSAKKTAIAPMSTEILGWTWSGGKLQAGAHRIAALAACDRPETVSGMRSYLGSYKFLCRVLKDYAVLLDPLEAAIAGKDGKVKISWSDELSAAFKKSQESLRDNKAVTLPVSSDILWIVTDGSLKNKAVGATLYIVRNGVTKLGGFFSSKVSKCQAGWLACEIEGIAIAAALHHFAPLIRQSVHRPRVLTDSKPCVQACVKFSRGQFSTSARLCTFLNAVGNYRAEVTHIPGSLNLASDFASRSPVECVNPRCEMCKFVNELAESVVAGVTIADIESGRVKVPFTNPVSWLETQEECVDLKQVKFWLGQGSTLSRKQRKMEDVRRYLSAKVMINSKGLLVRKEAQPLKAVHDRIVVPRSVVVGLLTSLHIQLGHPSAFQMKRVVGRYFFALDLDRYVHETTASCQICAAVRDIPHALIKQSTGPPPDTIGQTFAADIVKRHRQKIFIMRETVTSYTTASIIKDETTEAVTEAILAACSKLRPACASEIVIRVDPASAHKSLFKDNDNSLTKYSIRLDIGRIKNANKNPGIDKAIKEFIHELQTRLPQGGPISAITLDLTIATLNSRLRSSGLSAHELWTQRDQVSGCQLPIQDREVIMQQDKTRRDNHRYSELSKAKGRGAHPIPNVAIGDLVYIYSDGNKLAPRQRYMVVSIAGEWCKVRKMDNTLFASVTYDVRLDEIYKVPGFDFVDTQYTEDSDDDSDMVPVSWDCLPQLTRPKADRPKPIASDSLPNVQAPILPEVRAPNSPIVFRPPGSPSTPTIPIACNSPVGGPPGSPITGPPTQRRPGLRSTDKLRAPPHLKDFDRE